MRTLLLLLMCAFGMPSAEPDIEALMQNGHWKRARDLAEARYKSHPNDARAAWLLARARKEFHSVDLAVTYGETAVRLDRAMAAYHRTLAEAYEEQIEKLPFYKQLGQSHKIRAELEAALAIAPRDPENLFDQISYLLNAPAIAGGDKKKAANLASDLVKIDPACGYLAMATVARAQKEEAKLEGLYQNAIESNPRSYEARVALAAFYSDAAHRNLGLMEKHASAALDLNPDRTTAYRWLAFALASQKRFDETAKLLARAEVAVPDDLSPYVYAARALLASESELPKGEAYLKKYLAGTKEPEAGAPQLASIHWSLGMVYEKERLLPAAKQEMEAALRLKPDFEPAKRALKTLK